MAGDNPKDTAEREGDVSSDNAVSTSRFTGGDDDGGSAPDTHSTTGTTENDTFVGRTAGADTGYEDETGAEVRAQE